MGEPVLTPCGAYVAIFCPRPTDVGEVRMSTKALGTFIAMGTTASPRGEVVAIGPEVEDLGVGDMVIFRRDAHVWPGYHRDLILVHHSDVLAVLTEEGNAAQKGQEPGDHLAEHPRDEEGGVPAKAGSRGIT